MTTQTPQAETFPAVVSIAKAFMERQKKCPDIGSGKKADTAALNFMCGAHAGAEAAGNKDLAQHIVNIAFLVSVRGWRELERIASKN